MKATEVIENVQSILIFLVLLGILVLGIIDHDWLFVGIYGGALLFLAGFVLLTAYSYMQHSRLDFLGSLKMPLLFFKRRGYSFADYFGAGGGNPGIMLSNPSGENVKVILHYSTLGKPYVRIVAEKEPTASWKIKIGNHTDINYIEKTLSPYFGEAMIEDDNIEYSLNEADIMTRHDLI